MTVAKSHITNELFDAFLFCKYKPYLLLNDVDGQDTEYIQLVSKLNRKFRLEVQQNLKATLRNNSQSKHEVLQPPNLYSGQDLILNISITKNDYHSQIDAVKRVSGKSSLGEFYYEPIMFYREAKTNKKSKLSLTYKAFVLGKIQDKIPDYGTIIFGNNLKRSRIKLSPYFEELSQILNSLLEYINDQSKPSLYLNRYCDICQFKNHCREDALAKDHLSLLRGISETEIARHNHKGIFTVTQLSYTFRSRRKPKRAKSSSSPHSYPLQALALRENKIYIHGNPQLPRTKVYMYFDVEGLPSRNFDYLIGLLIEENGTQQHYSFWIDSEEQQKDVYIKFLKKLNCYDNYLLFHFGSYDKLALRRMRSLLPDEYQIILTDVEKKTVNLLSIIHQHIYFPTWSNSLKEIAKFLRFEWRNSKANGLQSIVWREDWESTQNYEFKEQLIQYNYDDCLALKKVSSFIESIIFKDENLSNDNSREDFIHTNEMKSPTGKKHVFGKKKCIFSNFNLINKYAYFDYQRDKVFIRTNKQLKKNISNTKKKKLKANKLIKINAKVCKICQSRKISQQKEVQRRLIDLKFFNGGVKKWITDYVSWHYQCMKCHAKFIPDGVPDHRERHGNGLRAWCVYHNIVAGQNMLKVRRALVDVFNLNISRPAIYRFKSYTANRFQSLTEKILSNIIKGPILHIDETEINLRDKKGYVWVFTSMDSVYFMYRESREAEFLKELLKDFQGVLISDFFSGYDSIDCPQQKCLIHLIRDMNEDLLSNPFDEELKNLTQKFAPLLRDIVQTIDKYGLKQRNLNKHKDLKDKFIDYVMSKKFSSIIAKKYQKRINKYKNKLFTFLDYDGVPWNNNNAEHAIKSFAKYRRFADGRPTEKSIREFLIMLSVLQTCEYRNIDILEFLLSGKNDFT
ncbi:MAG: TM0106 family RecB-like putative nuclease [Cyanobacteria bacterium P01_F01_bin.150]